MDWMVAKDHPCWKELEKRCTEYTAIGLCQNEVTTRKRCFQVKMPSARADGTPTRGNKDNCQTGAILTLACWPLAQNQPLRLAALAMATITQLEDHTAGVPMHLSPSVVSARTNNRAKVAAGAFLYECSRLFRGSFFTWLYKQIHATRFRPVACVVYMLYDKFRLTMRFEKETGHGQAAASQRSPSDSSKRSGGRVHAKAFQAGFTLALFLFDNMLQVGFFMHCDLATHCMAETTWHFLLLLLTLPILKDLMVAFPFRARVSTVDRAASNCKVNQVSLSMFPEDAEIRPRCEYCGLHARVPFPDCRFCGREPVWHHMRCCPWNPGHPYWCRCPLCSRTTHA